MDLSLLFPIIILILFIPLFLSSRKQKRQVADMQALQKSLEPGDVVTTTSGLRGTVVDASYEDTIDLEIADGVVTTWVRAAVRDKIVADEPAPAAAPAPVEAGDSPAVDGDAPTVTAEEPAAVDGAAALDREKDDSPNGSTRG
jgi:preprotein translocase subunit YajC